MNDKDVTKPQDDFRTQAQIDAGVTAVKTLVNNKTGFTLQERPVGLDSIVRNPGETTQEAITRIIAEALAAKQINADRIHADQTHDTGFDLVPPAGK